MKRNDLAGIVSDRHRRVIGAVVEEVSAKPAENSIALQLLKPVNIPADIIEHEIVSASGGKTQERVLGTPGKSVSGPSSTSKVYKPGSYQESIPFKEQDLLRLRKLGSIGERGATGLTGGELDWVERAAKKLKLRLQNRLHQLAWDALFTGQYVYQGVTFSFAIPAGNQLTAATDWSVAGTGKPFQDLVTLVGQNAVLRKYRAMIKCFVINPKTEADIIQRALEAGYINNNNIMSGGINEVRKFAAPGLPPFEVVADVIQDESEDQNGNITLGAAAFMVPDDKVLVVLDFARGDVLFPEYGQLQLTQNMNDPSATPESPAQGVYTFVDEEGLSKRKSPFLEIVAGFNGGPNLMRPNDTIIISV
jgi:hypothetical protein